MLAPPLVSQRSVRPQAPQQPFIFEPMKNPTTSITSALAICSLSARVKLTCAAVAISAATVPASPVVPVPAKAQGGGYIFQNLAGWLVETFSGSGDGFSGSGDGFFSGSDAGFSGSVDGFSGSAAGGGFIGNVDGVGGEAMFYRPSGVTVGSDGTIYVSDTGNNVIRKIAADGTVSKLAGNFLGSADGGFQGSADGGFLGSSDGIYSGSADATTGEAAGFKNPQGLALDNNGNILVADRKNHAIRKVTPQGAVTTIAGGFLGSGAYGVIGSSDGPTGGARFHHPSDVAVDKDGNIFVADAGNHAIRKIDGNGTVTTIAGSLGQSGADDGSGSTPRFNSPQGIAIDADGNIIVADTTNGLIRKIDGNGTVTTIAGALFTTNAGAAFEGSGGQTFTGSEGEGGRSGISGAARDYFTGSMDAFTGSAEAFLGSADMGWPQSVDGAGNEARFSFPTDVEVDDDGNIYVVDSGSGKIRKITPSGVVSTIGGTPDGFFYMPLDIAISSTGGLIVADSGNNRVAGTIANAKPVIALLGNNPLSVYLGDSFTDPGATVTDDNDEERTISGVGSVDTLVLGNYTLTYSTEDGSGLAADPVTRAVQVIYDPQGDQDGDGLTNAQEQRLNTDPTHFDSDLDGYSDKDEVDAKTDPLSEDSIPSAKSISFSSISDQLIGVSKIRSINGSSFAALTGTGKVVVWGSAVQIPASVMSGLSANVTEIVANGGAFAALKDDGSILTWGNATYGGNAAQVYEEIGSGITKIVPAADAFIALKDNGSVVAWGNEERLTILDGLQNELSAGVTDLVGDAFSFVNNPEGSHFIKDYYYNYVIAEKSDSEIKLSRYDNDNVETSAGTISGNPTWMHLLADRTLIKFGGGLADNESEEWPYDQYISFESISSSITSPVVSLTQSYAAFAAITVDGRVFTWGDGAGADSSAVADKLQSGVSKVYNGAWHEWFVALKDDGSVVLWGGTEKNQDVVNPSEEIKAQLQEIASLQVSIGLFDSSVAALKENGSVVTWGGNKSGGDSSKVNEQLASGVTKLYSSQGAFAALKDDGSVVAWGDSDAGGDSRKVAAKLTSGISDIYPVYDGFYAIKADEVVAWGGTVVDEKSSGTGSQTSQGGSGGGGGESAEKSKKGKKGKSSAKKEKSSKKKSSSASKSKEKKKKSSSAKKSGGSKKSSAKKSKGSKKSKGGKKKSKK